MHALCDSHITVLCCSRGPQDVFSPSDATQACATYIPAGPLANLLRRTFGRLSFGQQNLCDGVIMTSAFSPELLFLVGALVLVLSSLTLHRFGIGKMLKAVLAWSLIFAGVFVVFSFRYELEPYWLRIKGEMLGEATPISSGGEVRVRLGSDNHFHAKALVNGKPVEMLIDTGATFTAIGLNRARELGIRVNTGGFAHEMRTANGSIKAYPAKIELLQVGDIEMRDVTIFVAAEFGDVSVLGMNFLSTMKSWRVEGREMILVP